MASEESAEALSAGDPWWKVGSTTYKTMFPHAAAPGESSGITCPGKATTPIEALNRIQIMGVLPSDRKLYVEADNYSEIG